MFGFLINKEKVYAKEYGKRYSLIVYWRNGEGACLIVPSETNDAG